MYDLRQAVRQAGHAPCAAQQAQLIKAEEYLRTHNVHTVFNQLLGRLLEHKPEKPREAMIAALQAMKEGKPYFTRADFQAMYDGYDFFGNKVPYAYLLQALQKIGVDCNKDQLLEQHPQLKVEKKLGKSQFADILSEYYGKQVAKK